MTTAMLPRCDDCKREHSVLLTVGPLAKGGRELKLCGQCYSEWLHRRLDGDPNADLKARILLTGAELQSRMESVFKEPKE